MSKESAKLSLMNEEERAIYLAKKMDKKPLKSDFAQSFFESMRGEDGADGYTPVKGVDYFDGEPGYTPIKGVDYFDGNDGKNGKPGYTPIKGKDYFDGQDAIAPEIDIKKIVEKVKSEIKVPEIDAQEVIAEIKKLKGNDRLDISHIKNGEQLASAAAKIQKFDMNDQRWHGGGGGLQFVSHDLTLTGLGTPASPLSVVPDAATKYVQLFNATTDWGVAALGYYTITITAITHGHGTSPIVQFYETDGGTGFYETIVDQNAVNAVGDVAFRVTQVPDLRFAGKVIII